jgi:hypothetical protein
MDKTILALQNNICKNKIMKKNFFSFSICMSALQLVQIEELIIRFQQIIN